MKLNTDNFGDTTKIKLNRNPMKKEKTKLDILRSNLFKAMENQIVVYVEKDTGILKVSLLDDDFRYYVKDFVVGILDLVQESEKEIVDICQENDIDLFEHIPAKLKLKKDANEKATP